MTEVDFIRIKAKVMDCHCVYHEDLRLLLDEIDQQRKQLETMKERCAEVAGNYAEKCTRCDQSDFSGQPIADLIRRLT